MNVTSNDKILNKEFVKYRKNPTFDAFVQLFTSIVDAALRENVMDFFDIVFQECGMRQLNREQLTDLLMERMKKSEAIDIVEQIFFLIDP